MPLVMATGVGVATAACPPPFQSSGDGTYYAADGSGACEFPANAADPYVGAINAPQWNGAAHCGECLEVTGPLGSVRVRIVDECPECAVGDVDMHPDAFAQIAEIEDGRVPISWTRVDCPVSGNVISRVSQGSNPFYIGLVADHYRIGVADMSIRVASTWHAMVRQDYNRFVYTGAGEVDPPFDVRITSTAGEAIEQSIGNLNGGSEFDSGQQFSPCTDDAIFADGFDP
jgi:expansin (peptidoglycan-binding protein)